MASMRQLAFVFAIMGCKCVSEANASVTQSFRVHSILQLLVQSKKILSFGFNQLLVELATIYSSSWPLLRFSSYQLRHMLWFWGKQWTPIREIFEDLWFIIGARTSCVTSILIPWPPPEGKLRVLQVTAVCLLSAYLASAYASRNEEVLLLSKWTCWNDQLEPHWSSPLKLELTSTIFRCTFSVFSQFWVPCTRHFWVFKYSCGWLGDHSYEIKEEVQVAQNQWCQLSLAVHQQYFEH